ncbi:L-aspartate oxidase [Actinokineospora alba]|uniref:L-aspartate oxidase n=1 Tax=Actinokineospora alba TaxID=504798 RepID=A0A1H0MU22_9PSEU|nr:L-aspartate oxidase [Actinokineospora alba]TDP68430.1 L-aspartate oxidase [Actinokineospora alba]SDH78935.1 L-aspartate oxidase [Actinokineospora alba]SDO83796.1 L-aspartate oxidase [Actinokineospora alba]
MTSPRWEASADLVVVGTGVAGLTAALRAHSLGLRVLVVTKGAADEGNTRWAQGGVAVVLPGEHEAGDSVDKHVADTLVAGAGLCDDDAVRAIIADGPAAVTRLRELGAVFDPGADGNLARTREGGHSAFRVVHAGGDATGAEIERALLAATRDGRLPILEHHVAVQALRTPAGAVTGLTVLDDSGVPGVITAAAVLLASGGLGQLYQATSNPEVATGDGIALALRAGAPVADIEFVQFHPTVLYTGQGARGRCPLVTEAVRGEGAVLIDATGASVMQGVHPLADLAPRDVVAAAITRRMAEGRGGVDDHVFLDATRLADVDFATRFPTVYAACLAAGIDPAVSPIPVAPAAHFSCGGVIATVDGRTAVPGLYAAGEVASTGLHGANRLASNSLLEGLVVGARAAETIAADLAGGRLGDPRLAVVSDIPVAPVADRDSLQRVMSRYAAIGREAEGLAVVGSVLDVSAVVRPLDTREAVEDAALTLVARSLIASAAARTESRGCHVRTDFPVRDDANWRRSLVVRLNPSGQPVLAAPTALRGAA